MSADVGPAIDPGPFVPPTGGPGLYWWRPPRPMPPACWLWELRIEGRKAIVTLIWNPNGPVFLVPERVVTEAMGGVWVPAEPPDELLG